MDEVLKDVTKVTGNIYDYVKQLCGHVDSGQPKHNFLLWEKVVLSIAKMSDDLLNNTRKIILFICRYHL